MSGGGYRGRSGFGLHGSHYNNNPGSGVRNGPRHSGNYQQRGNYNNSQLPPSSHNNGPGRRGGDGGVGLPQDNWTQNRSFTRWEISGQNQPPPLLAPNWSHSRGEHYQNASTRYTYQGTPYQSRGGGGRNHYRGGGYRYSDSRGNYHNNPPYYNAPYRENTFHQHDQNSSVPEEPVPPLLGSEEERQLKITEAADELKRKLLSNRVKPQEESSWFDDLKIHSLSSVNNQEKQNAVIKGIPELKHGPPELHLTLSDLKDIGRVDIDSTINPSATESNIIICDADISGGSGDGDYDESDGNNVYNQRDTQIDNDDGWDIQPRYPQESSSLIIDDSPCEYIDSAVQEISSVHHSRLINKRSENVEITIIENPSDVQACTTSMTTEFLSDIPANIDTSNNEIENINAIQPNDTTKTNNLLNNLSDKAVIDKIHTEKCELSLLSTNKQSNPELCTVQNLLESFSFSSSANVTETKTKINNTQISDPKIILLTPNKINSLLINNNRTNESNNINNKLSDEYFEPNKHETTISCKNSKNNKTKNSTHVDQATHSTEGDQTSTSTTNNSNDNIKNNLNNNNPPKKRNKKNKSLLSSSATSIQFDPRRPPPPINQSPQFTPAEEILQPSPAFDPRRHAGISTIVPEFDPKMPPPLIASQKDAIIPCTSFNTHLSSMPSIIAPNAPVGTPINMTSSMPGYVHPGYTPIVPPYVSPLVPMPLPYSQVIAPVDYPLTQMSQPPLLPPPTLNNPSSSTGQAAITTIESELNGDPNLSVEDVLGDMKEALEFAKQCMVMGQDDEDDNIEFPTLPNLPPILDTERQHDKDKTATTKHKRTKKSKQDTCYGPHPNPESEEMQNFSSSSESTLASIRLPEESSSSSSDEKINKSAILDDCSSNKLLDKRIKILEQTRCILEAELRACDEKNTLIENINNNNKLNNTQSVNEHTGDDIGRRKVVFNLNAKFKKLNKTEEWTSVLIDEDEQVKQRRLKIASLLPAITEVAPTAMINSGLNKYTSRDDKNMELAKIHLSSEHNNIENNNNNSNSSGSNQKKRDQIQMRSKDKDRDMCERRDGKKYTCDTGDSSAACSDVNRKNRRYRRAKLIPSIKSETVDSGNEQHIVENISESNTPPPLLLHTTSTTAVSAGLTPPPPSIHMHTPKASSKKQTILTTPAALTESSWKDRVISRFLKMSKNDIQNMINNSSLRKFDIAMQHLVKEKKSSLSMEMRLNEDEKMKNSNNEDNEDFMCQLQAILDPAATVDLTNLPTTFIHQLSEVLHLDSIPGDYDESLDKSEPHNSFNYNQQDALTFAKDQCPIASSVLGQYSGINTPVISSPNEAVVKRKIDSKLSKDTNKNSSISDSSTRTRSSKRTNEVDTTNMRLTSTPMPSASTIVNNLNMDDLDDIFTTGIRAKAKSTLSTSTVTPKGAMTSNERVNTTIMSTKKINSTCMANDAISTAELDKIFSPVIAKTKATSMKANIGGVTTIATPIATVIANSEMQDYKQSIKSLQQSLYASGVMSTWKRKGIDDPDNFRNLTKEEYEARYGESLHTTMMHNDENSLSPIKSRPLMLNGRDTVTSLIDKDTSTQSTAVLQITNPTDSGDESGDGGGGSGEGGGGSGEGGGGGGDDDCGNSGDSDSESDSSTNTSSSSDENSLDVSKVLRYIKEREKIAKKKSINEEIRDEVSAEIEKKRREKSNKHKSSHKSKSKKRDKRKKDKRGKKKKLKKKRKRKLHHSSRTDVSVNENSERPLWLLREEEIKKEPNDNVLKSKQESPLAHLAQVTAINECKNINHIRTSSPQTVNPSTSHVNTAVTNVMKTSLTSPLRSNSSSCSPSSRSSESPLSHTKTKAQLKQMPEALAKTKDDKLITSTDTLISSTEQNTIQSQCDTDNILSPLIHVSTAPVISTPSLTCNSGNNNSVRPRKLDIKQYQERALQRKLKEQERKKLLAENPSGLTQDLLNLPSKKKPQAEVTDNNLPLIIPTDVSKTIGNQSINVTNTVEEINKTLEEVTQTSQVTLNEIKNLKESSQVKSSEVTPRRKLKRTFSSTSASKSPDVKTMEHTSDKSKFINIKSEGGKEMKLKEKLKKISSKPIISDDSILLNKTDEESTKKISASPSPISSSTNTSNKPDDSNDNTKTISKINKLNAKKNVPLIISSSDVNNADSNDNKTLITTNIDSQQRLKLNRATELIKQNVQKLNQFSHYFTTLSDTYSDNFPDTVAVERMEIEQPNFMNKMQCEESEFKIEDNEADRKILAADTMDLQSKSDEYCNPPINKEIETEINMPNESSSVNLVDITRDAEKKNSIKNKDNLTEKQNENKLEKLNKFSCNDKINPEYKGLEINSSNSKALNTQEQPKRIETKQLKIDDLMATTQTPQLLDRFPSEISITSDDTTSVPTSLACRMLMPPSLKDPKASIFDKISTDHMSDISDDENNSSMRSISKNSKNSPLRESNLLSKDARHDEEDELIYPPAPEPELESSLLQDQTLNTYETEDIETPSFSPKAVVLCDKVLTANNVRNSFLDDPITFSNAKPPTPDTMEFGILDETDMDSIYDSQLSENIPIDSMEDVPSTQSFAEDEVIDSTLSLCMTSGSSDNFIIHQNSSEQIKELPDRELIKAIEGTSPERLPSPILQVEKSPKVNADNDTDDNIAVTENTDENNPDVSSESTRLSRQVDDDKAKDKPKNIESHTIMIDTKINHSSSPELNGKVLVACDKTPNGTSPVEISTENISEADEVDKINPKSTKKSCENIGHKNTDVHQTGDTEKIDESSSSSQNILSENEPHASSKCREKRSLKDDIRKIRSSKSPTPPVSLRDHKKHKKRHDRRKKSKLTMKSVEDAVVANIVKPVLITKNSVMMRMQEIDLAIQRLMDEKMRLYKMLTDDKWPSPTADEPSTSATKIKQKTPLTTESSAKPVAMKNPRVVVSRLIESKLKPSTLPSLDEFSPSKLASSSTPKQQESAAAPKLSKNDEKKNKLACPVQSTPKTSKKRKRDDKDHKDDKDHSKAKEAKLTGPLEVKKRLHMDKKVMTASKPQGESIRKPFKLSQLLRDFKPKTPPDFKRRSLSPKELMTSRKTISGKSVSVNRGGNKSSVPSDFPSDDDANQLNSSNDKNKSLNAHKNSDKTEEVNKKLHSDQPSVAETPNLIYSDDSTWDHIDRFNEKSMRSTGLVLLEESMKREKAAKKFKSGVSKKKVIKDSKYEGMLDNDDNEDNDDDDDDDDIPLLPLAAQKKLKKKPQTSGKKSSKFIEESPIVAHVEEVINAVAINRLDVLYDNKNTENKPLSSVQAENIPIADDKLASNQEQSAELTENHPRPPNEETEDAIKPNDAEINESTGVSIETSDKLTDKQGNDNKQPYSSPRQKHLQLKTRSVGSRGGNRSLEVGNIDDSATDEVEWTTLDSVGFIDGKGDELEQTSDIKLEISDMREEQNNRDSVDITAVVDIAQLSSITVSPLPAYSPIQSILDRVNKKSVDIYKAACGDRSQEIDGSKLPTDVDYNTGNYDTSSKLEKSQPIKDQSLMTPVYISTTEEDFGDPAFNESTKSADESAFFKNESVILTNAVDPMEGSRAINEDKINETKTAATTETVRIMQENKISKNKGQDKEEKGKKHKSSVESEVKRPKSMVKELEKPRNSSKDRERPKSTIKELEKYRYVPREIERPKSAVKELEKSKTSAKVDRPKSAVKELDKKLQQKDLERPRSTVRELERPKSAVKELERPKSTVKELEKKFKTRLIEDDNFLVNIDNNDDLVKSKKAKELERNKPTVKELERPKSTVKEMDKKSKSRLLDDDDAAADNNDESVRKKIVKNQERPKSTVKELERPKSTVKELERPKSTVQELERPKSTVKELERPKSTVKELERPKSTAKELEKKSKLKLLDNDDSSADDEYNDERMKKKRERSNKNRSLPTSRRSSRQSDDSSRTSRSRSRSKRSVESPNSRDTSPQEVESNKRPHSGGSTGSTSSRKKSSTHQQSNKSDNNKSIRKRRRRKNSDNYDIEHMKRCKVRLIDCGQSYLQSDRLSDFLQQHGIEKINNWTLHDDDTKEAGQNENIDTVKTLAMDEVRSQSDDDSMELIQVDEIQDLQVLDVALPEDNADTQDHDVKSSPVSSEFVASSHEELVDSDFDAINADEDDPQAADIEVLENPSSPANIPTTAPTNSGDVDSTDSRRTQYTVHKGPILDIKVFGDSFLAASEDGAIYRYSQRSNGILNIYKGHDAAVTCLYIHEVPGTADSGKTRWNLFSGSLDATLRCYDIMNGSLDRHVAEVGSPIQCMDQAWGNIFVGTKSGHISRYDIKSGCLREDKLDFSEKPVLALRASTEGPRKVLIVASRNQPITIRDAQNGLFLRTISGQRSHTVYSLLRDRNLVYCGTSNTSIPVFDFITGDQVTQYTAGVGIVCMRLYKQLLFAGCYDGNIYVFDTKDPKLLCSIPGPGNMLLSMEIVNDEIIAGSKDKRLHAWRMPTQIRAIITDRT